MATVLVVDQVAAHCAAVQEALRSQGHSTVGVHSLAAALPLLAEYTPDLVVLQLAAERIESSALAALRAAGADRRPIPVIYYAEHYVTQTAPAPRPRPRPQPAGSMADLLDAVHDALAA